VIPPPYTNDWGKAGSEEVLAEAARGFLLEIPIADAGPGALILFRMARNDPAKHCGVRSAAGLIHAYKSAGVVEEPWSPIWRAKRPSLFFLELQQRAPAQRHLLRHSKCTPRWPESCDSCKPQASLQANARAQNSPRWSGEPATGNPPDPSGSTPKMKAAPLTSETPDEIGGQPLLQQRPSQTSRCSRAIGINSSPTMNYCPDSRS
jgi:hypothetical protein